MDAVHRAVWAQLGIQLACTEPHPHTATEDPLALCAGAGSSPLNTDVYLVLPLRIPLKIDMYIVLPLCMNCQVLPKNSAQYL